MQNILFLNEENILKANVKRLSNHTIQILGDISVNISGFHLLNDKDLVYGKFEDYTTLYKEIDGGFILSNDGSVYVEPKPEKPENSEGTEKPVEQEPIVPTLDEIKEKKIVEMNQMQQDTINNGLYVALSDGLIENFKLSTNDQLSLMALQTEVAKGTELIPWHSADESEHCKFYSNEDMKIIIEKSLQHVTYHVTYFRDLRIYIRSLENEEEVNTVYYGMAIPEEYQSEPLKAMIEAMS